MDPVLNSYRTKPRHLKESLKSQARPSLLQSSTRKMRSSRLAAGRHCPWTKRRQVQGEEDKWKFLIRLYFDKSLLIASFEQLLPLRSQIESTYSDPNGLFLAAISMDIVTIKFVSSLI